MGGGGGGSAPKPSEAERESSKIAIEKWNDYLRRYTPVEDRLQRRITAMGSDVYINEQAAMQAAKTAGTWKQAYNTPVNLNNAAQVAGLDSSLRHNAQARGYGQSAAPIAAQTRVWDAKYAYAQAGQGISGEGLGNLSKLGSIENSVNITKAKSEADAANSRLLTLGSVALAAGKAYRKWQDKQDNQQAVDALKKRMGG